MLLDKKVELERMTWPEAKLAIEESAGIALVPVGAVEEHGPHLPVGTDSIETYEIGRRAAKEAKVVITPLVWFGNSRSFMDFPGTISVNPETLKAYMRDVLMSLIYHGFTRPIILDGHGGNYGILDLLIEDIMIEHGTKIFHVRSWELATLPKPKEVPAYDGHGGSSETSAMMYLCPGDVNEDQFADSKPEIDLTPYGSAFPEGGRLYSKGPAMYPLMMGEMVKLGHHGDPRFGNRDRGEALLKVKVDALIDFIHELKANRIKIRSNE